MTIVLISLLSHISPTFAYHQAEEQWAQDVPLVRAEAPALPHRSKPQIEEMFDP